MWHVILYTTLAETALAEPTMQLSVDSRKRFTLEDAQLAKQGPASLAQALSESLREVDTAADLHARSDDEDAPMLNPRRQTRCSASNSNVKLDTRTSSLGARLEISMSRLKTDPLCCKILTNRVQFLRLTAQALKSKPCHNIAGLLDFGYEQIQAMYVHTSGFLTRRARSLPATAAYHRRGMYVARYA
ncbi:hypothetical protein C8R43DRAFT_1047437 [Mycena crocata]|nr:hypothetical protein C8R43DRAFT_1047437 [Mycena crocata]